MQIHTELEINAPAEEVWQVLVDFPRYGEWNPVITSIDGAPYVGEKISLRLKVAVGVEIPIFACEILVANAAQGELRWRGPAIPLLDQVLAGEHYFIVQNAGEPVLARPAGAVPAVAGVTIVSAHWKIGSIAARRRPASARAAR